MAAPGTATPAERSSSWWAITAQCAGGLALYAAVSLSAALLSGSAVLGAVVSGLVTLAVVALWRRWQRGTRTPPPPSVRAHDPGFWGLVLFGLVLCFVGGQTLAVWIHARYGSSAFDSVQGAQNAVPVLLLLFALVVAAPAGEEALMRGLVYPLLRRRWTVLASALASSAIFAVLHGNPVQIAVALPLGVLLAFVYEHVHRIWPVILLHALFNLASALVPVSLVTALATPAVFCVVLAGAAAAIAAVHPGRQPRAAAS
ncbi:type II CAAX endopeptidase family protein [Nocardiopsis sp. NPDC007018]|uniref:CPBP family intramembrane glutamic endopeptidase n=1 Tax=Nocardiopsis sp. NPDC007018 TaxID=3155721 RepID=UPI00340B1BC4